MRTGPNLVSCSWAPDAACGFHDGRCLTTGSAACCACGTAHRPRSCPTSSRTGSRPSRRLTTGEWRGCACASSRVCSWCGVLLRIALARSPARPRLRSRLLLNLARGRLLLQVFAAVASCNEACLLCWQVVRQGHLLFDVAQVRAALLQHAKGVQRSQSSCLLDLSWWSPVLAGCLV